MTTRPNCPKCGSGFVYTRKDGSVQCRRCGHSTQTQS